MHYEITTSKATNQQRTHGAPLKIIIGPAAVYGIVAA